MSLINKSLLFGMGILSITKEKAENLVNELVEKGEVGKEEALSYVNELMSKGEQERVALMNTIRNELDGLRKSMGLVTQDDLQAFENRLTSLETHMAAHTEVSQESQDSSKAY
ncbi:MAG TPA: hypothetical protein VHS59_09735 [Bacillota bacterium]|nr:hypothetical protein [Bacillota bacterium]